MMKCVLLFITLAALVCASELEENEQKKRGATKTSSLNAIPSGPQKSEYTYSIYSQPSQNTYQTQPATYQSQPATYQSQPVTYQSQPTYQNQASYQTQVPNSFYPTQGNQYYTTGSTQTAPAYPQPQISLIPSTTQQFIPINIVPSQSYQSKYPVASKSQNPVQYIVQQAVPSLTPYHHLLSQNQPNVISSIPPHNLVASNLASFPFHSPYLGQVGHPSMILFGQPNSLFNSLFYQNPLQSLYNLYPNSQAKYTPSYVSQPSVEYEKLSQVQGQVSQAVGKEDNVNGISHSSNPEYLSPQESVDYKNPYSRSSYNTKL